MIVADTSLLLALVDRRDVNHGEASSWYRREREDLVTTPLVLAEVDYLAARVGPQAVAALYGDLVHGAYEVEWWPQAAAETAGLAARYEELRIGLADASLVLLAARVHTTAVATFDHRHFRAVRPLSGAEAFTLLPADA